MVLNSKVVVKGSPVAGCGLFAVERVEKGETVWHAEEDERKYWVDEATVSTWPREEQEKFYNFAYQIDECTWSGVPEGVETDSSEYMNHSCDPNTVFVGDGLRMVAWRTIEPGEEVTYDYATSESENSKHTRFRCCCGTPPCRGFVTVSDYRRPELRRRYKGHFLPYLERRAAALDGDLPAEAGAGAEAEAGGGADAV